MAENDRTFTGNFGEIIPRPIKYGYQGPTTTANSKAEGRLKVDVAGAKRKILKNKTSKSIKASDVVHRDSIY